LLQRNDRDVLLRFSVTDTGIGLTEEQQARLFQSFEQATARQRANTAGRAGPGDLENLAQLMGGDVGVESRAGHGSTFWFTVTWSSAIPSIPCARRPVEPQHAGSGRVLLVEDNDINQLVASESSRTPATKWKSPENGQQAVDMVARGRFDLVLMDMQMPVMDGVTATREIRKLGFDTLPIIAMTANAMQRDRKRCMDAGMNDFVTKPIDPTPAVRDASVDRQAFWRREIRRVRAGVAATAFDA
jgi:CheY-like chemotaxis protein